MKKNWHIPIFVFLFLALLSVFSLSAFAADELKLNVSNGVSAPGDTAYVTVSITENPGFSSLQFYVEYDDVLTLQSVTFDEQWTSTGFCTTPVPYTNPQSLSVWSPSNETTQTGLLATLTFSVSSAAMPDDVATVSIISGKENTSTASGALISTVAGSGNIRIMIAVPGDIDSNGSVNMMDALTLFRFIAGWTGLNVNQELLDTDGNGQINMMDALHLFRYVAGWDIEIFPSNKCNHELKYYPKEVYCNQNGSDAYWKCNLCSTLFKDEKATQKILSVPTLSPIEHTVVIDPEVPATCTKSGVTAGKHCSTCHQIITSQQEIGALGHREIVVKGYSSTCVEKGMGDSLKCSLCGLVLRGGEVLPLISHNIGADGACTMCSKLMTTTYNSYSEYINDCNVTTNGNTVTVIYNRSAPVELKLSRFILDGGKTYVFRFGSSATRAKFDGAGGTYHNMVIEIDSRSNDFNIEFESVYLSNYRSVITSKAPCLNLSFKGSGCSLSTKDGANGSDGESSEFYEVPLVGLGGRGGNANTVIVCDGELEIICATTTDIRGGNGGNGGKGGNNATATIGNSGGSGGDGGNGAMGISASAIRVYFENGKGKENITIKGGIGGLGGAGGYSAAFLWFGTTQAPNGNGGVSATGTNVVVQYN